MENNLALKGFIGYSAIYLLTIFLELGTFSSAMKPFLLPFLIYAVYRASYFQSQKILISALLFSWLGDIVLLYTSNGEMYFIIGLLLFLISHLFYIKLFMSHRSETSAVKNPLFWIGCGLVLCYLYSMLNFLLPTLGELKIPVALYAATISAMLIFALKVYFSLKKPSRFYVIIGATSFVVSDSLLAVDKFHAPLPYASLLIMITYLFAQYSITFGMLKLKEKRYSV